MPRGDADSLADLLREHFGFAVAGLNDTTRYQYALTLFSENAELLALRGRVNGGTAQPSAN